MFLLYVKSGMTTFAAIGLSLKSLGFTFFWDV